MNRTLTNVHKRHWRPRQEPEVTPMAAGGPSTSGASLVRRTGNLRHVRDDGWITVASRE